jgi:hypothetical protein
LRRRQPHRSGWIELQLEFLVILVIVVVELVVIELQLVIELVEFVLLEFVLLELILLQLIQFLIKLVEFILVLFFLWFRQFVLVGLGWRRKRRRFDGLARVAPATFIFAYRSIPLLPRSYDARTVSKGGKHET